jgi:uncharacterized membrane protein
MIRLLIPAFLLLPVGILLPYVLITRLNNASDTPSLATYLVRVFAFSLGVGLVGFLGGFLGTIIFAPQANPGPLLGIFITGPLGVVLGVILSWVWLYRATKNG